MNPKVHDYLKKIASFSKKLLVDQARKLGLRIKQRQDREKAIKLISELDPRLLEQYLDKPKPALLSVEQKVQIQDVSQRQKYRELLLPTLSSQLTNLLSNIVYINNSRMDYYRNLFYQHNNILIHQNIQQHKHSLINSILGLGRINSIHQPIMQEQSKQQGQATSATSESLLKTNGKNKKVDKKQLEKIQLKRQFVEYEQSLDHLQILISTRVLKRPYKQKYLKKAILHFQQRQKYNSQLISIQNLQSLALLIMNIEKYLNRSQFDQYTINYFTISLAASIINSPAFQTSIENGAAEATLILRWIYKQVKIFIKNIESSGIDKSLGLIFLQTLNKYKLIKYGLMNLSSSIKLPQASQIILGTNIREWPTILLIKFNSVLPEVGVGQLGGRRVLDKLNQFLQLIQFLNDQRLELGIELVERIVTNIRNCIYWIDIENQNIKNGQLQSGLYCSQIQQCFNFNLCSKIIKILFINVQANLNISLVVNYFWSKFFDEMKLNQQNIQNLFLLINLTIRYKQEELLKQRGDELFALLSESVDQIFRQQYKDLNKREVIDFIKEEATRLLPQHHREQIISKLS